MHADVEPGLFESFADIMGLPPEMRRYPDLIATPDELALVVALGRQARSVTEIAALLGRPEDSALAAALEQARLRGIIVRLPQEHPELGEARFTPSTAYRRLTYLSMQDYGGWQAVAAADRGPILAWHLAENIKHHDLERRLGLLREAPDEAEIHNRDFLLLEEALAMVDAAALHVVVPCDCRTTVMACDFPRWDTCLRLDARGRRTLDEGEGRIVTRAECRDIVIHADRVGLMHTGQRADRGRPPILNGNCCACCSYPIRAGIQLGMDKLWPRARYRAERDADRCDDCGICAQRCHFSAFFANAAGKIEFEPDRCHGCGLCATGCPRAAVRMTPLDD